MMDPLTKLLAPIAVLVVLLVVAYWCRGWLVRRRLKREGRWLDWAEVVEKARSGQGCLIVNYGNIPGRVWWVEEISDHSVAYILSTSAYLTNCPIRLRGTRQLQRKFPDANVIETHESVFGHG